MGVSASQAYTPVTSSLNDHNTSDFVFPYEEHAISANVKHVCFVYITSFVELKYINAHCILDSDQKVTLEFNKYNWSVDTDGYNYKYTIELPTAVMNATFDASNNIRVFTKRNRPTRIWLSKQAEPTHLFIQGNDQKMSIPNFADRFCYMDIYADSSPKHFKVYTANCQQRYPAVLFLKSSGLESVSNLRYEVSIECHPSKAPLFKCKTIPTNYHWILYYS